MVGEAGSVRLAPDRSLERSEVTSAGVDRCRWEPSLWRAVGLGPARRLALWFLVALQGQCAAQWDLQPSGTKARLRGISVVSGKVAWATGAQGTVLRTMDGGANWRASVVPGGADTRFPRRSCVR